jgi:twinkle protein
MALGSDVTIATGDGASCTTTTSEPILGAWAAEWFEKRGIDPELATRFGIHTVRNTAPKGQPAVMVPDPRGNVLAFPIMERGAEVGMKYRAPQKQFWQREGGKRTFWNSDVLDEPALHDGRSPLIIVEGEPDCLAAIGCGYPFTVSVPDGASPVPKGKQPTELDPLDESQDAQSKFEFLWNNRARLKRVKRYVIAVDNDGPGIRLAAELVRRLGVSKCSFVTYPPDCKDLNDVLMKHGPERVKAVLDGAQRYPVRGLYDLDDYPARQDLETFHTGFDGWSPYLKVFPGEFIVVSGIPSHGKSTFALNLVCNLAQHFGWRAAICGPEMPVVPQMRNWLRRHILGRKPADAADEQRADAWIKRHFSFIDTDPTGTGDQDEAFDLEWIIERAEDAVMRHGIKVLVLDPWNEIEHARRKDETVTDYIARGIRMLKRFAKLYGVMVIVVAHPTKAIANADSGRKRAVTLYDVEGSASWYNKADHGIIVQRPDMERNETVVIIEKVRFIPETGKPTKLTLTWDAERGRYIPENIWAGAA